MSVSDKANTLRAQDHGHPPVVCMAFDVYNMQENERVFKTLNSVATDSDHIPVICFKEQAGCDGGGKGIITDHDKAFTVPTFAENKICYETETRKCIGISRSCLKGGEGSNGGMPIDENIMPTMQANGTGAICYENYSGGGIAATLDASYYKGLEQEMEKSESLSVLSGKRHVLRRLTPIECARLQGFPDWWTDGADGSDSNIYKMWGNGIALPCAADVIGRLAKELGKD